MAARAVATATVRAMKGDKLRPRRAGISLASGGLCQIFIDDPGRDMTAAAVQQVKSLLKDKPDMIGLRIGVRERGCNGLSYLLEYASEERKFDEKVSQDGITILIDSKAQLSLLGSEMDFVESKLASEFVFNNPNIKGTCGCGESFHL